LRTALVKQALDVFGPWCGVKWKDTSPEKLFEVWPGKAVYWELTCMLQADWYIVPQARELEYTRDAVRRHLGRAEIIHKYTRNVTPANLIPLQDYDLVIAFDAVLDVPRDSSTLFAYYVQEHWDQLYSASLRQPERGYDLFLAHMMDSNSTLRSLPQAISFPYPHDLNLTRSIFPASQEEVAWIDWRTLMTLAMRELGEGWNPEAEAAADRLRDILGIPIDHRGNYNQQSYGFTDPPSWGDLAKYLRAVRTRKYYVSVGRIAGAGQSLAEAASLGSICIGQKDTAYHRLICHPAGLCEDLAQMPVKLKTLAGSKDLQQEVFAYQDEALRKHFEQGPLDVLNRAIQTKSAKRKNGGLGRQT
jgi:hypothetical protein